MMTKIYALVWLLTIASAGLVYFTGNASELTLTVFGFVFATLTFMGIVAVLPYWVDRHYSWKYNVS